METKKNKEKEYTKDTLAGGCFWYMLLPYEKIQGVVEVVPSYTSGKTKTLMLLKFLALV